MTKAFPLSAQSLNVSGRVSMITTERESEREKGKQCFKGIFLPRENDILKNFSNLHVFLMNGAKRSSCKSRKILYDQNYKSSHMT